MLRAGAILAAFVALIAIAGGYLAFSGSDATAGADFTVTKQSDSADGVCNNDCSLREAIQNANSDPGPDVIAVPAGTYILNLGGANEDADAEGDLDISSDITIQAMGHVTIDGNGNDRIFDIRPGATLVSIIGVDMQNGHAPGAGGGGISVVTNATLFLQNCSLTGSDADSGGGGISILGGGNVNVSNCTLDNNTADGQIGGNLYVGANSVATLSDCTIADGKADYGAGAYVVDTGQLSASGCTFIANNAQVNGGGIDNGGQVFITNSTTNQNHSGNVGGFVYTNGVDASTVINNSTLAFDTGDIAELYLDTTGAVSVQSTILRSTGSGLRRGADHEPRLQPG